MLPSRIPAMGDSHLKRIGHLQPPVITEALPARGAPGVLTYIAWNRDSAARTAAQTPQQKPCLTLRFRGQQREQHTQPVIIIQWKQNKAAFISSACTKLCMTIRPAPQDYQKVSRSSHGSIRTTACPISTCLLILLYSLSYYSLCVFVCNKGCLQNAGHIFTFIHSPGL